MDSPLGSTMADADLSFKKQSIDTKSPSIMQGETAINESEDAIPLRSDLEKRLPAEPPDAPVRPVKGVAWALLCIAVFSAQFLFSLDNTIVADVQPSIVEDLSETEKLPWITVAFELGAVSANLFW